MTSDERQAPLPAGSHSTNDDGAASPDRLDRLDRYWDAVTGNGYQRAESIALDPARARTVDLLQTYARTDTARIPDAARARIWRETVAAAGIPIQQEPPMVPSSMPLPGGNLDAPTPTMPASSRPTRRRPAPPTLPSNTGGRWTVPGGAGPSQPTGRAWWPRLQFGVAAVLILGLFATILAPMDDGRVGLFGGIGNDATPTATTGAPEFAGGGSSQTVPAFQTGLALKLYQLTLPANGSFELPDGSVWMIQGLIGNGEFVSNGEGQPTLVNATRSSGSSQGGRITNIVDRVSVFWVSGLVPHEAITPPNNGGARLEQVASADVSSLVPGSEIQFSNAYRSAQPDPTSLRTNVPPSDSPFQPVAGSREPGLVYVTQGQIRLNDLSERSTTLAQGGAVSIGDVGPVSVTGLSTDQGDGPFPDRFYSVSVQPYAFNGTARVGASTVSPADIPSIGYPEAFTGGGSLIDLPVSSSGHTVSLDRVTLATGATLALPAGSTYRVQSATGQFTVERANGTSPLSIAQTSSVDLDLGGGTISADQGEDATVTVLTIAPEGTVSLASANSVTVYPLTTWTTGGLRFERQQNVLLGSGPVPVDPEPVPPSTNTDDPQNLAANGTTMLLYAEQGSIEINSPDQLLQRAGASNELPSDFATSLTIAQGESAVVSNPSRATIQQATAGEGAVYSVAFLSPPGLDRTAGRTYPNTFVGGGAIITVPADGDDYQIVLDRLTIEPGATAVFPPGTFRVVQWTGGGTATLTSNETVLPPYAFEERALTGTFQDAGGTLTATGDTPVTMTLMSYLPTSATEVTVPTGMEGVTGERLAAYTATDPFNADQIWLSFYASPAMARPVEIDPGLAMNLGGANPADSYALIRPEAGPIVLNRPARQIVDGVEAAEFAAGSPIPPSEIVRVDDLRDATIQGPTDGSLAGYTLVVVSPYDDPYATGPDANSTPELTGLTPANLNAVAEVPGDQPLTMELVRQTLAPNATMTINPVYAADGVSIPLITVLSYAATGDATINLAGEAGTELSNRSEQVAMSSLTSATPITIRAGTDGITIYQLVIAPVGPEFSVNNAETTSGSEILGAYSGSDLLNEMDPANDTVEIDVVLRASVNALRNGSNQTLGRDSAITLLTPLVGDARITPGVGEVRVTAGNGDDPRGAEATTPMTVAPGGSVIARPGGMFRIAAETDIDNLSYLWAEIRIDAGSAETVANGTPPVATPAPASPPNGTPTNETPIADTIPACDVTPRTVEELLALYDEGIASPVDPYTLGHREDIGTGTPADDATIAAVTDTLLRQSACQSLNDPLRQFALYSDDYLRVVLPLRFDTRDQLASLLDQPAATASEAALLDVSISDVELFVDGRVGARVALDHEFAYVTFTRAADGTWLMDLLDDRDEPGA